MHIYKTVCVMVGPEVYFFLEKIVYLLFCFYFLFFYNLRYLGQCSVIFFFFINLSTSINFKRTRNTLLAMYITIGIRFLSWVCGLGELELVIIGEHIQGQTSWITFRIKNCISLAKQSPSKVLTNMENIIIKNSY